MRTLLSTIHGEDDDGHFVSWGNNRQELMINRSYQEVEITRRGSVSKMMDDFKILLLDW